MPIHVPLTAPQRVVDLTRDDDSDDEFDPNAALKSKKFGEPDPFEYIDPQKANENLKALLEGAIDDEHEEAGKKRKLPKQDKKMVDIAAKASDGAKSLAEKLKLLEVKDEKDSHTVEDEKAEDEDDDEGVVEGLNVKLLPHQVDGVAWMIERESGAKKRGVLPKGGILADDVSQIPCISCLIL
jgi:SNF2 family DNA or RNA helicase